jgi:lambda family phage tail tape measure protein
MLKDLAAELDSKVKLKKQNEQDLKLATLAANLKDSNVIVKQGFDMELAGAGSGEKLRGRLKEDLAIQQDYAKQRSEMYKQYKEADLLGDPDAKSRYDKETGCSRKRWLSAWSFSRTTTISSTTPRTTGWMVSAMPGRTT